MRRLELRVPLASTTLSAIGVALLLAGCASRVAAPAAATIAAGAAPAVLLVVRVAGGDRSLSPKQLSNIQQAVQDDIKAAGYRFAPNSDVADYLITVRFTPNGLDPDGGHVAITGIEPNPMKRRRTVSDDNVSPETKELRQKMRDTEHWIQSQPQRS